MLSREWLRSFAVTSCKDMSSWLLSDCSDSQLLIVTMEMKAQIKLIRQVSRLSLLRGYGISTTTFLLSLWALSLLSFQWLINSFQAIKINQNQSNKQVSKQASKPSKKPASKHANSSDQQPCAKSIKTAWEASLLIKQPRSTLWGSNQSNKQAHQINNRVQNQSKINSVRIKSI